MQYVKFFLWALLLKWFSIKRKWHLFGRQDLFPIIFCISTPYAFKIFLSQLSGGCDSLSWAAYVYRQLTWRDLKSSLQILKVDKLLSGKKPTADMNCMGNYHLHPIPHNNPHNHLWFHDHHEQQRHHHHRRHHDHHVDDHQTFQDDWACGAEASGGSSDCWTQPRIWISPGSTSQKVYHKN